MENCTIVGSTAPTGTAIYSSIPTMSIVNSIIWDNGIQPIYGQPDITYSNVQGGYPGTGNINDDPSFVYPIQNDYRLQWESPCIDAGDPDPLYNDPDSTVTDMGACYYDQSMHLRVLMTPFDMPIEIPAAGGSFDYYIQVTNIALLGLYMDLWCDITLPNGNIYGPVLGPVSMDINSGQTIGRERTQNVPAGAPAGMYSYNAYATAGTDTSTDSFTFVKLGTDGLDGMTGWFNTGDSFNDPVSAAESTTPETYSLEQNYPNPFNPATTIRFGLPVDCWVRLEVFDVTGRFTESPLQGFRDAGYHEVTFDALGLSSGIYIYRLTAGDFTASGKMVLMK